MNDRRDGARRRDALMTAPKHIVVAEDDAGVRSICAFCFGASAKSMTRNLGENLN
jgi:hypothetical protein